MKQTAASVMVTILVDYVAMRFLQPRLYIGKQLLIRSLSGEYGPGKPEWLLHQRMFPVVPVGFAFYIHGAEELTKWFE
jgi:hypothetical protein